MDAAAGTSLEARDLHWSVVGGWEAYEGEVRTNLLRLSGIVAFYLVELADYRGFKLGPFEMPRVSGRSFHLAVTALAVAWTMVGLGVMLGLRGRAFPRGLKYISTGCDLVLLTALLTVANGPRSPLIAVYFVILALASLRFRPLLMWFATVGAVACYLFVLGYARWFTRRDISIPRDHEVLIVLALVLTGVILGQVTRRARAMAEAYSARLALGPDRSP
jgi:hypothetical protein